MQISDPEGKEYIDCLSAYSAVNQGHCHPKIVKALCDQAQKLTLSSRAFYSDKFGEYARYITQYFGYEMVLPANSGAEAVETAIKVARKWGYVKKKIPADKAIILSVAGNFHGRTTGVISMSTDPESRTGFGPFLPRVGPICPGSGGVLEYGNVEQLRSAFEAHGPEIAGIILEPIQGEAGIVIPPPGYLREVQSLCRKHNALWIDDEIQTGLGRTGKMMCYEYEGEGVRPDIITLGKALSGGVYPVSAVLSSKEIMLVIEPGSHGSTFAGNALACSVAMAALEVIREEDLVRKSYEMGEIFRRGLTQLQSSLSVPILAAVRGRGLFNAIDVDEKHMNGRTAWHLCVFLKERGVLCKPTHETTIRLSPPLTITEPVLQKVIKTLAYCLENIREYSIAVKVDSDELHHKTGLEA